MGFLKRVKVPDELPDLAIEDNTIIPGTTTQNTNTPITNPIITTPTQQNQETKKEIPGETYLEFKEQPTNSTELTNLTKELENDNLQQESFFNKVLENINEEIEDLGKLEDWYKDNFKTKDVVSDMKYYWEENKADVLIKSFGSEYKKKITERIKNLQNLEEEWRAIYFKLIKKEEDMKKEEKELKETLAEFVDLCKRRRTINNEETTKKETQE